MEQQLIIAGIQRMQGTGKQSGKAYDFCKVNVLQPIQQRGPVTQAHGFEAQDMNCEDVVLGQLNGANFPCVVKAELVIGRDTKVSIKSVTILDKAKVQAVA